MPSNHSQFICFGAVYVAGYCIIHYTDKPFWERNMCVGVSALLAVLVSYSRCVVCVFVCVCVCVCVWSVVSFVTQCIFTFVCHLYSILV